MKQRPQGLASSSHLISSMVLMVTADKQALLFTVILEPLSNFMRENIGKFPAPKTILSGEMATRLSLQRSDWQINCS